MRAYRKRSLVDNSEKSLSLYYASLRTQEDPQNASCLAGPAPVFSLSLSIVSFIKTFAMPQQDYSAYTVTDHHTWSVLFSRQLEIIHKVAYPNFSPGLQLFSPLDFPLALI